MSNSLVVHSTIIQVSKFGPDIQKRFSNLPNDPYAFFLRVHGILPGCRKNVLLTSSPTAGGWVFSPLFGHNGRAFVTVDDYRQIVEKATVVKSVGTLDFELTLDLITLATNTVHAEADCLAIHVECHPNYRPAYTPVEFELI